MKKSGFTIAEILVTLAVVGVVAALTIPTLVNSNKDRIFSSTISTAISNFENAMNVMIMKDGANDLFGTKAWRNLNGSLSSSSPDDNIRLFMGNVGDIMGFDRLEKKLSDFYNDDSAEGMDEYDNKVALVTKNNVAFLIYIPDSEEDKHAKTEQQALSNGTNLSAAAAYVTIDVNGAEKPNTEGKDIYSYILGADGILYSLDSEDVTFYKK